MRTAKLFPDSAMRGGLIRACWGFLVRGCLLVVLVAHVLLIAGCVEIHTRISLQLDGTGVQTIELVVLRRELEQLSREVADEVEQKIRAGFAEEREKSLKEGVPPAEVVESIDASGNRVFTVSSQFRKPDELFGEDATCSYQSESAGAFRSRAQLRCQFHKNVRADVPVLVTVRVRMPGTIESTNGMKQSDEEALWRFPKGFRRGDRIEVSAVGTTIPSTYLAIGAALAAAAVLGGAWLTLRRRGPFAQAAKQPAEAGFVSPARAGDAAKVCGACGARSVGAAQFCRSCGARFEAILPRSAATASPNRMGDTAALCRTCGTDNPVLAKFCRNCGAPMEAGEVPGQRVPVPSPVPAVVRETLETPFTPARSTSPSLPTGQSVRASGPPVAPAAGRPSIAGRWLAVGVLSLALLLGGGWVAYRTLGVPSDPSEPTVVLREPAKPQMPSGEQGGTDVAPSPGKPHAAAPSPAAAATVSPPPAAPPIPMALDAASNCYVWKPSLNPNETVKWSGSCARGLASGPGKAEWSLDGVPTLTYEGTYGEGVMQGAGRMLAAAGDRYEGEYRDGKRDGRGTYLAASGERYEGDWRDNKREGRGVLTYTNGDRYEGDFRENKRHGNGTYTTSAGERYVGEYRDDRREGRGVLVRADGTRFEGAFKDGKPVLQTAPAPSVAAVAPSPAPRLRPPQPDASTRSVPPATPSAAAGDVYECFVQTNDSRGVDRIRIEASSPDAARAAAFERVGSRALGPAYVGCGMVLRRQAQATPGAGPRGDPMNPPAQRAETTYHCVVMLKDFKVEMVRVEAASQEAATSAVKSRFGSRAINAQCQG